MNSNVNTVSISIYVVYKYIFKVNVLVQTISGGLDFLLGSLFHSNMSSFNDDVIMTSLQTRSGPSESQSLGHHDLLQVLVFLSFLLSLFLQQRHQRVSLLHHLQHLLQNQTLLHQLPLLLQMICTRPGQTGTGQDRPGETRTDQLRPGQTRRDQERPG